MQIIVDFFASIENQDWYRHKIKPQNPENRTDFEMHLRPSTIKTNRFSLWS